MPVELRNEQRVIRVDTRSLKRHAEKFLDVLGCGDAYLSILLTDDRRMAQLHERWMGDPDPTDVLSFSGDDKTVLGDIAISVETAARRSPRAFMREITRYLIHGTLHLVGHDHATKKEKERMNQAARRLWKAATQEERVVRHPMAAAAADEAVMIK